MKNAKKIISLILVISMIAIVLASCESEGGGGGKDNSGTYDVIDKVPDDLDFEGETFTVLCREDNVFQKLFHEIEADENATDIVSQAVYERNLALQERLNIVYDTIAIPGYWDAKDDFISTFKNSILAGDAAFDLIMSQAAYMSEIGLAELYLNWNDIPYVKDDLDAPYFYKDEISELTVNNKLFYLLSDYHLTFWESMYALYFNKQIAENENIEDLYALVKNGTWTIDKLIDITKGLYQDVNGNGYIDDGDRFGYITCYANTTDALYSQFECQPTIKTSPDTVELNVDTGKMVSVLEKMIAFFQTDDVYAFSPGSVEKEEEPFNTIFTEDRALFYPERLNRAEKYRGMETDFGILPYPKWNEAQAGYYTQAQDGYSVAVAPIDIKNPELTGAAYDILSAVSYQEVIPAYYDISLKDKYARDDESGEMLDIIREGCKINFGYFYYHDLGYGGTFRLLIEQENSNYASYYAANEKGYRRNLKKIMKIFEDTETE